MILYNEIFPEGDITKGIYVGQNEVKFVNIGDKLVYDTFSHVTYDDPIIDISYPVMSRGGCSGTQQTSPTITYQQTVHTWGHSGNYYGSIVEEGSVSDFTIEGAILNSSEAWIDEDGIVYRESLNTTYKPSTWNIMEVTISAKINGKSSSRSVTVQMESNTYQDSNPTVTYSNVIAGTISNATIPASSGTRKSTAGNGSQKVSVEEKIRTYQTGCQSVIENAYSYDIPIPPSISEFERYAGSKGTDPSDITIVDWDTVIWESADGDSSKNASGTIYVYQQANKIESTEVYSGPHYTGGTITYGTVYTGSITPTSVSDIPASGGSVTFTAGDGSQYYSISARKKRYRYYDTYTSGSESDPYYGNWKTITNASEGYETVYPHTRQITISGDNLGTTPTDRASLGRAVFYWYGENDKYNWDYSTTVYQEANIRTDHFSLGKITVSYPNGNHQGGIVNPNVTVEYINNPSYTSNTPVDPILIDTITPDRVECTIISGTGGTVQGGAINWSENTSTQSREMFITVTVYYKGLSKTSDTIRVIQHAKPATTQKGRKAKIINNTSCTLTIQFTNSETFTLDIPAMQTVYKDLIIGQDVEGNIIDAKIVQSGWCKIDSAKHIYWCSTDYLSEVADVWTINSIS